MERDAEVMVRETAGRGGSGRAEGPTLPKVDPALINYGEGVVVRPRKPPKPKAKGRDIGGRRKPK